MAEHLIETAEAKPAQRLTEKQRAQMMDNLEVKALQLVQDFCPGSVFEKQLTGQRFAYAKLATILRTAVEYYRLRLRAQDLAQDPSGQAATGASGTPDPENPASTAG